MARVNYAHGKRQREIANKQKREEKAQRKAERQAQGLSSDVGTELEEGAENREVSEAGGEADTQG